MSGRVAPRRPRTGATARRILEPRLVFPPDRRWYLAARNVEKGEEHLHRLDRAVSAKIGPRFFTDRQGAAGRTAGKVSS